MIAILSLFIIGIVLGSFCAAMSYRIAHEVPIFNSSRSFCDICRRTLTFIDLIPIFSYIFFRGKCRTCHGKISPLYPIAELIHGILFAAIGVVNIFYPMSLFTISALGLITFTLMLISLVDIKTMYVYDICVLFLGITCIIYDASLEFHFLGNISKVTYSILGTFLIIAFKYIYEYVRSFVTGHYTEVLGLGDIKILFFMLFFLDFTILPFFFTMCGFCGLLFYGLNAVLRSGFNSSDEHFPFAPSICFSFFVALLVQ